MTLWRIAKSLLRKALVMRLPIARRQKMIERILNICCKELLNGYLKACFRWACIHMFLLFYFNAVLLSCLDVGDGYPGYPICFRIPRFRAFVVIEHCVKLCQLCFIILAMPAGIPLMHIYMLRPSNSCVPIEPDVTSFSNNVNQLRVSTVGSKSRFERGFERLVIKLPRRKLHLFQEVGPIKKLWLLS